MKIRVLVVGLAVMAELWTEVEACSCNLSGSQLKYIPSEVCCRFSRTAVAMSAFGGKLGRKAIHVADQEVSEVFTVQIPSEVGIRS